MLIVLARPTAAFSQGHATWLPAVGSRVCVCSVYTARMSYIPTVTRAHNVHAHSLRALRTAARTRFAPSPPFAALRLGPSHARQPLLFQLQALPLQSSSHPFTYSKGNGTSRGGASSKRDGKKQPRSSSPGNSESVMAATSSQDQTIENEQSSSTKEGRETNGKAAESSTPPSPTPPPPSLPSSQQRHAKSGKTQSSSIFEFFENAVTQPPSTRKRFYCFDFGSAAYPKNIPKRNAPPARGDAPPVTRPSSSAAMDEAVFLSKGCGEDSYFVRPDSLGVADGVGGWSQTSIPGANAALYSRKLMHFVSQELEKFDDIANNEFDYHEYISLEPQTVLTRSYERLREEAAREGLVGSTTAAIVILREDELRVCNLGDCGIMVIRDGATVYRSVEQQHSFNFPFQLGTNSRDSPSDADTSIVKVQEGDVVLVASDGIFDNLFDEEILRIVAQHTHPHIVHHSSHNSGHHHSLRIPIDSQISPPTSQDGGGKESRKRGLLSNLGLGSSEAPSPTTQQQLSSSQQLQNPKQRNDGSHIFSSQQVLHSTVNPARLSEDLARRAKEIAEDSRFATSPFQSRAIEEGLYYAGGKMDDITITTGIVIYAEDSPDRR